MLSLSTWVCTGQCWSTLVHVAQIHHPLMSADCTCCKCTNCARKPNRNACLICMYYSPILIKWLLFFFFFSCYSTTERTTTVKAYQINTVQWFVIFKYWILQLWKLSQLQPCLLVHTCGPHLCLRTPDCSVYVTVCLCPWLSTCKSTTFCGHGMKWPLVFLTLTAAKL